MEKNTDFIIGIIALILGSINLILHTFKPTLLRKLVAMKEKFGAKKGFLIHLLFYVILPLVVGIFLVFKK